MSKTTDRKRETESQEEEGSRGRIVPPSEADIPEDANVVDLRNERNWMRPPRGDGSKAPSEMDEDELEDANRELDEMLEELEDDS